MTIDCQFAIVAEELEATERAQLLAAELRVPIVSAGDTRFDFLVLVGRNGLSLQDTTSHGLKPLVVDFGSDVRLQQRTEGKKLIAKAVKTKARSAVIWDVTGGLARDAFILASLGYNVTAFERSVALGVIVKEAIKRAETNDKTAGVLARLEYKVSDSREALLDNSLPSPDVIYMDPMFPPNNKTALPKKELQILRRLVGDDFDAADVWRLAMAKALTKVVVKRPRRAPPLVHHPMTSLDGKTIRFDIYQSELTGCAS